MPRPRFSSTSVIWALTSLGTVGGLAVALMLVSGCQNYRDQLSRGQGYYEQNQYEAALSVWRNLEPDQSSLSHPEVVRYCYLRGMTDYRLGYKAEARYWLGLSQAALNRVQAEEGEEAALQADEIKRLGETLTELNNEVYGLSGTEGEGAEPLGDKCEWTSDCDSGFACQDGICVQAEAPSKGATAPSEPQEPTSASAP